MVKRKPEYENGNKSVDFDPGSASEKKNINHGYE
jgi:hypothetical protein